MVLFPKVLVCSSAVSRVDFSLQIKSSISSKVSAAIPMRVVDELTKTFTLDDLVEDDCFLLDCGDQAFVWIGKTSTEDEKKKTLQITIEYLKAKEKSLRDTEECDESAIALPRSLIIPSGQEPIQFTRHFPAWRHKVCSNLK